MALRNLYDFVVDRVGDKVAVLRKLVVINEKESQRPVVPMIIHLHMMREDEMEWLARSLRWVTL